MTDTNAPKVDTSTLLANLKKKADPTEVATDPVVPIEPVVTAPELAPLVVKAQAQAQEALEEQYQQYTSSRVSTCLITPTGKRINFTNYQYYTKDPTIVAYLDSEIEQGLRVITKGKKLTAAELDPEAAKKREIIEEFKASQEGREFGNTKDVSERTSTLNSDQVAN